MSRIDEIRGENGILHTLAIVAAYMDWDEDSLVKETLGAAHDTITYLLGEVERLTRERDAIQSTRQTMQEFMDKQTAEIARLEKEHGAALHEVCRLCETMHTATGEAWFKECASCEWAGPEEEGE